VASSRAPWWLPGGHAQTIYASACARRPAVRYRRERWETPDGDFIDLDWIEDQDRAQTPLVALFHGLEGSSRSHYAAALMSAVSAAGWRGVVVHFRGCSGEPNRLPRAYHSGDSAEIDWIALRLRSEAAVLHAAGVSLGGNALLKWLGENGTRAGAIVSRAVAVSAPVDLMAAGEALGHGFNLLYARHFLATLKPKGLDKLLRHPGLFDAARVRAATTLRDFDDVVTGPLHGFTGVDDYWTRASSKPWLAHIAVPTLVLNARNDPFLPAGALPKPHEVAPAVTLEQPEDGGHAGFVSGPFPGNLEWLPERVLDFLGARENRQR
jgi:predicted alpha/beta-fold hydrolase